MIEIPKIDTNLALLSKALLITVIGVLFGFIVKHIVRKVVDVLILNNLFKKDVNAYTTSKSINKILTEIIQWIIILIFFNYSLVLLDFNFLSNIFAYIVNEIPKIIVFLLIVAFGILAAKFVGSKIRNRKFENKEEISLIFEIIISTAFILSGFEYLGIRATAILELFKVILYILAAITVILIIRPDIVKSSKSS